MYVWVDGCMYDDGHTDDHVWTRMDGYMYEHGCVDVYTHGWINVWMHEDVRMNVLMDGCM